jgi:hypothetical protein
LYRIELEKTYNAATNIIQMFLKDSTSPGISWEQCQAALNEQSWIMDIIGQDPLPKELATED